MSEIQQIIPIKNIFYMLCYAWRVLEISNDVKFGEDDFDNAYNLLARVFSFGIGRLIRSGFHHSYIENVDELDVLRGKILIKESMNNLAAHNRHLCCSYDEYSKNDSFNQILRYTIDSLLRNNSVSTAIKKELRKQRDYFSGIDPAAPTKETRQKLVFDRNNVIYRLLINIAVMLYDGTIVNDEEGKNLFKDFYREELMHKVFEQFLLNFYSIHLEKHKYKVHAPRIYWHIDGHAAEMWEGIFDIDTDPGDRRTDIVIENKEMNLQLIFDAKYYQRTFVEAYMNRDDERVRASHLNQIRGYLLDSDFQGTKYGALLYPMINSDLENGRIMAIEGTNITIKTINLNREWREIENDLLEFVKKFETGHSRLYH